MANHVPCAHRRTIYWFFFQIHFSLAHGSRLKKMNINGWNGGDRAIVMAMGIWVYEHRLRNQLIGRTHLILSVGRYSFSFFFFFSRSLSIYGITFRRIMPKQLAGKQIVYSDTCSRSIALCARAFSSIMYCMYTLRLYEIRKWYQKLPTTKNERK